MFINHPIVANFRTLAEIKRESNTPADTVNAFIARVGYDAAAETIAAAINRKTHDGRLYDRNRTWAASITREGFGEAFPYIDDIHPAHLNQIADAMRCAERPADPEPETEPTPEAETEPEPEQKPEPKKAPKPARAPKLDEQTHAVVRELLKINRNALRLLSEGLNLDFAKPFKAAQIRAPFTVRKAAIAAGYDPADLGDLDGVIITFGPDAARDTWRDGYKITPVFEGAPGLEFLRRVCSRAFTGFGTFYRKEDFNSRRKDNRYSAIVIFQPHRDAKPAHKAPEINPADRYTVADLRTGITATRDRATGETHNTGRYIDRATLRPISEAAPRLTYCGRNDTDLGGRWLGGFPLEHEPTAADILDKSGYPVILRRDSLRRRAEQLRRDRAKAAADAVDGAAALAPVLAECARVRKALAASLAETDDIGDLCKLGDAFGGVWRGGFFEVANELRRIAARIAEKKYTAPAQIKADIDRAAEKLAALGI